MSTAPSTTGFCCSHVQPYHSTLIDDEPRFATFLEWVHSGTISGLHAHSQPFIIQLVRQVNYGPLLSVQFFQYTPGSTVFTPTTQSDLIKSNYTKKNSFKNFRCDRCNLFFEINLYEINPHESHHWRLDVARPFDQIDVKPPQQMSN